MHRSTKAVSLLVLCAGGLLHVTSASAQEPPANLGFEQSDSAGMPFGWRLTGGAGYQLALDSNVAFTGKRALRSHWVDTVQWASRRGTVYANALSTFPVPLARGRKLHFSGYIRTENMTAGFAGFVMLVSAAGRTIAFDNGMRNGASQTTPWTRYDIELPVDSGATSITIGITHRGNGTAWFDSLSVEVVGPAMPRTIADDEKMAKLAVDSVALWLASHAVHLRTVEARNGFDDMQPLKQIVGAARVVALGEATHGTREFFQLKHRMLEFLVSEMGFTAFGIEATMPEAFAVNEYVLTGKGDPASALAGLGFWTWDTDEVLDMIHWMRQYNAETKHVKKVKFYGFDMQSAPLAVKTTLAYLRRVNPEQVSATEKALALLANPITYPAYGDAPATEKAAALAAIRGVLGDLDAHKSAYIRTTSTGEWAVARQHASIVAQHIELRIGRTVNSLVRDSAMAENILWILDHEGPGTKMVVWAHNAHVATQDQMMGSHLRQVLGANMVVFGFAFNEGDFQAREGNVVTAGATRRFTVAPAPDGSLDATLAAAGLQVAAIDLRVLPKTGGVAEWFENPSRTRSIGGIYSVQTAASFLKWQVTPTLYDALLFVEKTTAARANMSSSGAVPQKLGQPTNLDLETGELGQAPAGWTTQASMVGLGFESTTTPDEPFSGLHSAKLSRPAGTYYGESAGSLTQGIDATPYRGKRIRLRVMARTDAVGDGNQGYVRLQFTDTTSSVPFDNLIGTPVTSTDWKSYEVEADVPADADAITYGVWLIGTGRVWMDAVSIEVVPKAGQGGGSSGFKK